MAVTSIDPLELYAAAIDASDYVARLAPLVRAGVPDIGDLLDVGAGGGQLGQALRDPQRRSTAIEPSPAMRARLCRLQPPPKIIASGWKEAEAVGLHDTVLAATMPAFFEEPETFLARCRDWSRRTVVWVVPAHRGPKGLCFAGCLPTAWHREDETPGIDIVLQGLATSSRPRDIAYTDWTFTGVIADLAKLASYLADRLGWPENDTRRPELAAHLRAHAKPDARGFRLEIPRKSAVLFWGKS